MCVSLRRYDFVVKVIKNGRRHVKNSLVLKERMSHVLDQILGCFIPFISRLV